MGRGTLVPDRYVEDHASQGDIEISSIIWGLSLGCTLYTFFAAGKQTLKSWRRAKTLTVYMALVWLEWASSTIMGVICWCFLKGSIQPSLEYFMAISTFFCKAPLPVISLFLFLPYGLENPKPEPQQKPFSI